MPALPTLFVNGNGTGPRNWSGPQDFSSVDEPIGSPDGLVIPATVDTDLNDTSFQLQNMPSDFGTMNSDFSYQIRYRQNGRVDDTVGLSIRVVSGATVLAAADSGGTFQVVNGNITSSTMANSPVTQFTYVNPTADKTAWDAAEVELRQTYSQNMNKDGVQVVVETFQFTGNYTVPAPPPVPITTNWRFRSQGANFLVPVNSATFGVNAETTPDFDVNRGFRLRIGAENTGSTSNNVELRLAYSINSGAFNPVEVNNPGNADGRTRVGPVEIRRYQATSVDGTATTQLITSGTFTAGAIKDAGITRTIASWPANNFTELEYVLWFHRRWDSTTTLNQLNDGDSIEFRLEWRQGAGAWQVVAPDASFNPVVTVNVPPGFIGGVMAENPAKPSAGFVCDGNGNLYAIGELHEVSTFARGLVMKSADGGATWTVQDYANGPSAFLDWEGLSTVVSPDGREWWIFVHNDTAVRMFRYRLSTTPGNPDTWADATGELVETVNPTDQAVQAVLRADGTVVAVYTGPSGVRANIRAANGVWGTPFDVWTGLTNGDRAANAYLVGTNVICFANPGATWDIHAKMIDSSDVLRNLSGGTTTAAAAGDVLETDVRGEQALWGVHELSATSFVMGWITDSTIDRGRTRVISGIGTSLSIGSLGAAINADGIIPHNVALTRQPSATFVRHPVTGNLWAVYAKEATQDAATNLFFNRTSLDNGATWDTEFGMLAAFNQRGWGERIQNVVARIYQRAGNYRLGIVYSDASLDQQDEYAPGSPDWGGYVDGFQWFVEINLGGAAVTGTATPTLQDHTAAASGTFVPPPITGTGSPTLQDHTSISSGTVTPPAVTGTAAPTLADHTGAASGTVTGPSFTGTADPTLQDHTSAASGTVVPPPVTGTAAPTLADDTSTTSGTVTVPAFTGTVAVTLDDDTSTASGTVTVPTFTGTVAVTLTDHTATASGTVTVPAFTGTADPTLDDHTAAGAGTVAAPAFTGTATPTLDDHTAAASGTFTPQPITGTATSTLDDYTATTSGTVTVPAFTGTAAPTLDGHTAAASGTFTPQPITGTATPTLQNHTAAASGTVTIPGIAGSGTPTLQNYTSTASGTFTPPAVTGTATSTLTDHTATASGTVTVPAFTGTADSTLDGHTSAASGTVVPPAVTGTATPTLQDHTAAAVGTVTAPAFTGTATVTLGNATAAASGTVVPPPITGTATPTLADATSTTSGTVTTPTFTGTATPTLDDHTAAGSGTVTAPTFTGSATPVLDDHTGAASGTFTVPAITGTVTVTLDGHTATASGTVTLPGIAGNAAITLQDHTATAAGTVTVPAFTGTAAVTLTDATPTASGTVTIPAFTGTAAPTLADHTATASGVVVTFITGTATPTLADHTASATGTVVGVATGQLRHIASTIGRGRVASTVTCTTSPSAAGPKVTSEVL